MPVLQKLSTIAFRWYFIGIFFAYVSLTSSANWKRKTASHNKMLTKCYILQRMVENFRTNNMVTPCQKIPATCFYAIYRSIFKKCARSGSVLWATCVLLKINLFPNQLYLNFSPSPSPFYTLYPILFALGSDCDVIFKLGYTVIL